jgi:hypothetical protein
MYRAGKAKVRALKFLRVLLFCKFHYSNIADAPLTGKTGSVKVLYIFMLLFLQDFCICVSIDSVPNKLSGLGQGIKADQPRSRLSSPLKRRVT